MADNNVVFFHSDIDLNTIDVASLPTVPPVIPVRRPFLTHYQFISRLLDFPQVCFPSCKESDEHKAKNKNYG